MKPEITNVAHGLSRLIHLATAVLLLLGVSLPANAALGGNLDSVQSDQSRLQASVRLIEAHAYTVHVIETPFGTVVREYVSSAGRVFGVAWEGPFIPDLEQLLGPYFSHFSRSAKVWRQSHVGRQPMNILEADLVVRSAGHMRAYSGRAFDPRLLPEGVSGDDVR